jgi:2'-hydroxyisoflavone reductase
MFGSQSVDVAGMDARGNLMNRREFVGRSLLLSALATGGAVFPPSVKAITRWKKILVIGGTNFLGPAVVEAALTAGHDVTLFNRGLTHPEWFPHLEKLRGLRDANRQKQDLTALNARHWDAVIDVWPSDPDMVATAAEFLKDRTDHYLYVSSCSAYESKPISPEPHPLVAEDYPLCPFESSATGYRQYQVGKAESERRARAVFGEKCTIVRPGVIKGYRDDRPWCEDLWFYLVRVQRGGRQIGPGTGIDSLQLIDVKDVARFLVRCVDLPIYGIFNVAGEPQTFQSLLELSKRVTLSDAEPVWIPQKFLHEQGLESRTNFPLWSPNPENKPWGDTDYTKATRAGLRLRPAEEMVSESLEWFAESYPRDFEFTYLSRAKEAEVLAAWARHTS